MNSPSSRSSESTMPSSRRAFRPLRENASRVPLGALIETSPSADKRAASFLPLREILRKSPELASTSMARHASRSKPYATARSRVAYPSKRRAPRRPAFSARRYQSELYPAAAADFGRFLRYRGRSAGPGTKTYASAFESAAHSDADTWPSFVVGSVSTDRQ